MSATMTRRQKGTGKAADKGAGLRSAQHSEAGAAKPKTRFRMIVPYAGGVA